MDWDPTSHYKDIAVAERYNRERFSGIAGRVFNALERRVISRAFRPISRSLTVLDLPCGTGRLAETLLADGFHVVGVDISPSMLEVARRKLLRFGSQFQTRVGDVRELARAERGTYDVALCAGFSCISRWKNKSSSEERRLLTGLSFFPVPEQPYQRMRRESSCFEMRAHGYHHRN
jgi:SAM-dependent methyltransferase